MSNVEVKPSTLMDNLIDVIIFDGELEFCLSFADAKQLAKNLNDTVTRIITDRRLQELIDAGRERY